MVLATSAAWLSPGSPAGSVRATKALPKRSKVDVFGSSQMCGARCPGLAIGVYSPTGSRRVGAGVPSSMIAADSKVCPSTRPSMGFGGARRAKACVSTGDRMRTAFRFIGVQQRWGRPPGHHTRKFPGQVVRVGDATVHAEAALGSGQMRGVPGQNHPSGPVPVGNEGGGVPEPVTQVPHVHAVVTEASAHQLNATLLRDRLPRLGLRVVGHGHEPAFSVVDCDEQGSRWRPTGPRRAASKPVDGALTLRHPRSEIGADQDAEPVPHNARTTPVDAQRIAGATLRPVRGDEVGGANRHAFAGHDHGGRHAVVVLGETDELGREAHVGVGHSPFRTGSKFSCEQISSRVGLVGLTSSNGRLRRS